MRIHWTAILNICIAVIAVFLIMFMGGELKATKAQTNVNFDNYKMQSRKEPLQLKVVLEKVYLDGEISEEIVHETVYTLSNFWAKYDDWQFTEANDSQIVFRKQIDDISPLLKANGFFGITSDGVLSIFNGKPDQSKIIQSFFQIDIKKLESKKQEELIHGIPIKTKDHFVEVLETFKPYSKDIKQKN
ncbi:MAG: intercompartmental signaling factor BofC [Bacillota bacterium]|nr:intercompartmental signaling factor BofC [Bacillota bacterium]